MRSAGTRAIASLESAMTAAQARIALANRYPMRIRPTRSGTVGVTISGTEYVMTIVELRALRDLVVEGIGRVVGWAGGGMGGWWDGRVLMADTPIPELRLIATRAEAKACGAATFFTGRPCKHGHVAPRRILNSVCVGCDRAHSAEQKKTQWWPEYKKRWLELNPEKNAEYKATSRERRRERLLPEKMAKREARIAWREATADERLEAKKQYSREYWLANREKVTATIKACRLAKPEHYRKMRIIWSRLWLENNRPKARARWANRKARRISAGGSFTAEDVERIKRAQKYKCGYCKTSVKKKCHVDHIMPLALGGSNGASNLQVLCPTCNLRKSFKHPIEYARLTGRLL